MTHSIPDKKPKSNYSDDYSTLYYFMYNEDTVTEKEKL